MSTFLKLQSGFSMICLNIIHLHFQFKVWTNLLDESFFFIFRIIYTVDSHSGKQGLCLISVISNAFFKFLIRQITGLYANRKNKHGGT